MNRSRPLVQNPPAHTDTHSSPKPKTRMGDDIERSFNSADIFCGAKAVVIQHLGTTYRLQATKQGKLILTK